MFKKLFGRKPTAPPVDPLAAPPVEASVDPLTAPQVDLFETLTDELVERLAGFLAAARDARENDTPYAYVLTNTTAWSAFDVSIMTETELALILAREASRIEAEPDYQWAEEFRWGWWEWGTGECLATSELEDFSKTAEMVLADHYVDYALPAKTRDRMQALMIEVLRRLDERQVFGSGRDRDEVLIYPGIYDGGFEQWTLAAARDLNPSAAWDRHGAGFTRVFGFETV